MSRSSARKSGADTPMMKQYLSIKRQHPESILFFRMGDFYEMFMEDAVTASRVLKIALTSRDKGKDTAVPMCGVPHHAAESYLTRLVKAGHKVAICDQVEDPRTAKGLVKRQVTRVVTPGTAVEDGLLEAGEPSYLASMVGNGNGVGFAVLDVSTGDFRVAQWEGDGAEEQARLGIDQFSPREILLAEEDGRAIDGPYVTRVEGFRFDDLSADEALRQVYGVHTLEGFGIQDMPLARAAAGAILWYVGEVYSARLTHLKPIRPLAADDRMILDGTSLRNLEILRSTDDGTRAGSLLHLMDRTVTSMGARLLKEMVTRPLKDKGALDRRLDLVQEMVTELILRERLRSALKRVPDIERILSRLSAGSAGPRDLLSLRQGLEEIPGIRETLADLDSVLAEELCQGVDELEEVKAFLARSLAEEPPASLKEGGIIREGFSRDLDELRALDADGKRFISGLEDQERRKTGIGSLKVGYNKVFGYYLEVTNAHRDLVPDSYIRKQTLVNAERYVTQELKEMEEKILTARERMIALERELFQEMVGFILKFTRPLQETAASVAGADVFSSLAELAHSSSYCRPEILDDDPLRRISITAGRHPVLESLDMGESFVPNDAYLDSGESSLLMITGPNMAGKSTYMRQVALIVIMAQVGSFVPAKEALISPSDRIFTRVGAADALTKGLSTFMVEMVETAQILNNAGPDSLIVLDEIGRGTSTFDGISIAWAVAERLLEGTAAGCRTLFATHYHELTELALTTDRVKNYNVAIREWGERLVFLRTVQEGPADGSYGIQVARLAGLPTEVIERARVILRNLEESALDVTGSPVLVSSDHRPPEHASSGDQERLQMEMFRKAEKGLLEELKNLDLDNMTPVEALNELARLKRSYDREE